MQLPRSLVAAIEAEAVRAGMREVHVAAKQLSEGYRAGRQQRFHDPAARAAYLALRAPATWATCIHALRNLSTLDVRSAADYGCGAGASSWALASTFPQLETLTMMDVERPMLELSQQLAPAIEQECYRRAMRRAGSYLREEMQPADMTMLAWTLNELSNEEAERAVLRVWAQTKVAMVIVEPGMPVVFPRLLRWREMLLAAGAHLAAPCPGAYACPMQAPDWCHFTQRIERSSLQRRLRGGTLSYEDEKFSYLVFTRQPSNPATARIVRRPVHSKGLIQLSLCKDSLIVNEGVRKADKDKFAQARKAEHGDGWV
jgi:ribosomal protein RSM22 (predicted rRNA methylase)